jgi:hypothetical protein
MGSLRHRLSFRLYTCTRYRPSAIPARRRHAALGRRLGSGVPPPLESIKFYIRQAGDIELLGSSNKGICLECVQVAKHVKPIKSVDGHKDSTEFRKTGKLNKKSRIPYMVYSSTAKYNPVPQHF